MTTRHASTARLRTLVVAVALLAVPAIATACEPPAPTCLGRTPTIKGTAGPDVLNGTSGPDVIAALGGDDVVRGLEGDDVLCGGPGRDRLLGGDDFDQLDGGTGADVIDGEAGHDVVDYSASTKGVSVDLGRYAGPDGDVVRSVDDVIGSSHDDDLVGDVADNQLLGGAGSDLLVGTGGSDQLIDRGGAGETNTFKPGPGDDLVSGGASTDVLSFDQERDVPFVTVYLDTVATGEGTDILQGVDAVIGTDGPDVLHGGPGPDRLEGRNG
ncbi:MAG: hypothetical protein JO291_12840, partial [Acidimicrobiia bacterium]|nr:hypothetical protein [Acidimicrobiia bacterium]